MVDAALHLHRYIEAYGLGPERVAPATQEADAAARAARQRVKQEQHAMLYGTNNNGGTK